MSGSRTLGQETLKSLLSAGFSERLFRLTQGCYSGTVPQRRNLGGARREASERVVLRIGEGQAEIPAWTLNVSRGGLRLVVEEPVVIGGCYSVAVGEAEPRQAQVIWVREEADGQIAGLKFVADQAIPAPTSGSSPA